MSDADRTVLWRRGKRKRSTHQQRRIERVLMSATRPVSVLEIHGQVCKEIPTLGMATVYRTVSELEEAGKIRQVVLPKDSPRYEPAHQEQSAYFRCLVCNRVYWVFASPPGLSSMVPDGFRMDNHQVVLYGTCASCLR